LHSPPLSHASTWSLTVYPWTLRINLGRPSYYSGSATTLHSISVLPLGQPLTPWPLIEIRSVKNRSWQVAVLRYSCPLSARTALGRFPSWCSKKVRYSRSFWPAFPLLTINPICYCEPFFQGSWSVTTQVYGAYLLWHISHLLRCISSLLQCISYQLWCISYLLQCTSYQLQCFSFKLLLCSSGPSGLLLSYLQVHTLFPSCHLSPCCYLLLPCVSPTLPFTCLVFITRILSFQLVYKSLCISWYLSMNINKAPSPSCFCLTLSSSSDSTPTPTPPSSVLCPLL